MAEATSTSSSSTPSTSSTTSTRPTTVGSEQYILESSLDNALQPDALRGSQHLLKDANIEDREQTRRDKMNPEGKSNG